MFGGTGHDTYYVDSTGDVVIDFADQGYDVIYTSATYGLDVQSDVEAILVADPTSVTATNLAGNAFDQAMFGNDGINVINGHGGNDSLHGRGGDDQLYGGDGMDTLNGGAGNDAFVFEAGFANGDIVIDFAGNGDAAGDTLHFIGYGPGAAFTQVDNTHWQIAYNGGASVEVITFLNGGANGVHTSDIVFV
jgi:Ca2+-binding RTX toxin-like protein